MGGETVGLGALLLGFVFVVGAVRGTWKKVAGDLLGSGPAGQAAPDQAANGPGIGNPSGLVPGAGGGGVGVPSGVVQCLDPRTGRTYSLPAGSTCLSGDTPVGTSGGGSPTYEYLMATGPSTGGITLA